MAELQATQKVKKICLKAVRDFVIPTDVSAMKAYGDATIMPFDLHKWGAQHLEMVAHSQIGRTSVQ